MDIFLKSKSAVAVGLIIIGVGLVFFFILEQDEKRVANTAIENKNEQNGAASPNTPRSSAKHIPAVLTGEPVMSKGFNQNTSWRDPFAPPQEVAGAPEQ